MRKYIWHNKKYPRFTWEKEKILGLLTHIAVLQGKLLGKMLQLGFGLQQESMMNALTEEITKSSEIEGEILNSEQVRSSLARHLDINLTKETASTHHIDGMVETMMDAVRNFKQPLTKARLFGWHASLFPTGYSGMNRIRTGKFRDGEMQVVSIKGGHDIVHYQAPPSEKVPAQMTDFLKWLNKDGSENPLLKAAIAHLWFVIIHPFDDGNGRITRIITEMLLARCENTHLRFYSMSAQIQKEKKEYYRVLEQVTTGSLDITPWLQWFFGCLGKSIKASDKTTGNVLKKADFWQKNALEITNTIQRDIINRLFDGFEGNLTSGKAAKIFKVSQDTSARLLKDLVDRGFLQVQGGGRSTHYTLTDGF
ncbi:MAG: Fic family protein [Treponema sp.]|nr:Fic family protein [Treponema sp.]